MFMITFLYLMEVFTTTRIPVECTLQASYVSKLGDKFTMTCPNSFKDLGVEWNKGKGGGNKIHFGNKPTLTFEPLGLEDSGEYSCAENIFTAHGFETNLYETKLLVVDYHCFVPATHSSHFACNITYVYDGEGMMTIRLCDPLQQSGVKIDTLVWKEGNKINHVFLIDKSEQNCVYTIVFVNSTLIIWPEYNQSLRGVESVDCSPNVAHGIIEKYKSELLLMIYISSTIITILLLFSLYTIGVMQAKWDIHLKTKLIQKNNRRKHLSQYEEIAENISKNIYLTPI